MCVYIIIYIYYIYYIYKIASKRHAPIQSMTPYTSKHQDIIFQQASERTYTSSRISNTFYPKTSNISSRFFDKFHQYHSQLPHLLPTPRKDNFITIFPNKFCEGFFKCLSQPNFIPNLFQHFYFQIFIFFLLIHFTQLFFFFIFSFCLCFIV